MGIKHLFPLALLVAGACSEVQTSDGSGRQERRFTERSEASRVEKGYFGDTKEGDTEDLYTYFDPMDGAHYGNVFRMSHGRIQSIGLTAKSHKGTYAGDELDICDVTDLHNIRGADFPLDGSKTNADKDHVPGQVFRFDVHFARKGDDVAISLIDEKGCTAKVSLNALYRWRISNARDSVMMGDKKYRVVYQTHGSRWGACLFPEKAALTTLDPAASRAEFYPTYVVELEELKDGKLQRLANEYPLGSSGYVVYWLKDGRWNVRLAK